MVVNERNFLWMQKFRLKKKQTESAFDFYPAGCPTETGFNQVGIGNCFSDFDNKTNPVADLVGALPTRPPLQTKISLIS